MYDVVLFTVLIVTESVTLCLSQGGTIELDKSAGNNYPLRGGKLSDFEGGVRAVTVVTGGALPAPRRRQVEDGMMHIAGTLAVFPFEYVPF